jgi:hypothetical protein
MIDRGGGNVGPLDKQRGRDGTRLQVAITKDGKVLRNYDYKPGMSVSSDVRGAQLGFYFADGSLGDNSGHFDVRVRETSVQSIRASAAIGTDPERAAALSRRFAHDLDTVLAAASIPLPSTRLATVPYDRAITADARARLLETPDGYRFEFDPNELRIYRPGDDIIPATTFQGRGATRHDGTTWRADAAANYYLPNGSMFRLEYDGEWMKRFTLANGDSKIDVMNGDRGPDFGRIQSGGYRWRRDQVENNVQARSYRMGGFNHGLDDLDVSWNIERHGRNIGRIEGGLVVPERYVVDAGLRGKFGTQQYERMLRAEIEDMRSTIAGEYQRRGMEPRLAETIADFMLGRSGQYDRYARAMLDSKASREGADLVRQLEEQAWMQRILGGLPNSRVDYASAMVALAELRRVLDAQNRMRGAYDNAREAAVGIDPRAYSASPQISPRLCQLLGIDPRALAQSGIDPRILFTDGIDALTLVSLGANMRTLRALGIEPSGRISPELLHSLQRRESAFDENPRSGQVISNMVKGAAVSPFGGDLARAAGFARGGRGVPAVWNAPRSAVARSGAGAEARAAGGAVVRAGAGTETRAGAGAAEGATGAESTVVTKGFARWLKKLKAADLEKFTAEEAVDAFSKVNPKDMTAADRAACKAMFDRSTGGGAQAAARASATSAERAGMSAAERAAALATARTVAHAAGWAVGGLLDAYFINEGLKADADRGDGSHIERNKAIGASALGTGAAVGAAIGVWFFGWGIVPGMIIGATVGAIGAVIGSSVGASVSAAPSR